MSAAAFTPALYAAPHDLGSAKAWIEVLVDAGLSFHLEDDADDALGSAVPNAGHRQTIEKGRAALYSLGLDWGVYECPIGYLIAYEKATGLSDFWTLGDTVEFGNGQTARVAFERGHGAVLFHNGRYIAAVTAMEDSASGAWVNPVDGEVSFVGVQTARAALAWALACAEFNSPKGATQ